MIKKHKFKVVKASDGTIPIDDRQAIERSLERWLSRVRSGEVTGVAIAATTADGGISVQWSKNLPTSRFTLLGAVSYLKHAILEEISDLK